MSLPPPPPPPSASSAGGVPPPPPGASGTTRPAGGAVSGGGADPKNQLLGAIRNFSKANLKKTETKDESAPIVAKAGTSATSAVSTGASGPAGGSPMASPFGGGDFQAQLMAKMRQMGKAKNQLDGSSGSATPAAAPSLAPALIPAAVPPPAQAPAPATAAVETKQETKSVHDLASQFSVPAQSASKPAFTAPPPQPAPASAPPPPPIQAAPAVPPTLAPHGSAPPAPPPVPGQAPAVPSRGPPPPLPPKRRAPPPPPGAAAATGGAPTPVSAAVAPVAAGPAVKLGSLVLPPAPQPNSVLYPLHTLLHALYSMPPETVISDPTLFKQCLFPDMEQAVISIVAKGGTYADAIKAGDAPSIAMALRKLLHRLGQAVDATMINARAGSGKTDSITLFNNFDVFVNIGKLSETNPTAQPTELLRVFRTLPQENQWILAGLLRLLHACSQSSSASTSSGLAHAISQVLFPVPPNRVASFEVLKDAKYCTLAAIAMIDNAEFITAGAFAAPAASQLTVPAPAPAPTPVPASLSTMQSAPAAPISLPPPAPTMLPPSPAPALTLPPPTQVNAFTNPPSPAIPPPPTSMANLPPPPSVSSPPPTFAAPSSSKPATGSSLPPLPPSSSVPPPPPSSSVPPPPPSSSVPPPPPSSSVPPPPPSAGSSVPPPPPPGAQSSRPAAAAAAAPSPSAGDRPFLADIAKFSKGRLKKATGVQDFSAPLVPGSSAAQSAAAAAASSSAAGASSKGGMGGMGGMSLQAQLAAKIAARRKD